MKDKVLNLEAVQLPEITVKYFEDNVQDNLSEPTFKEISPLILPMMKNITQKDYEMRVSYWIEKDYLI